MDVDPALIAEVHESFDDLAEVLRVGRHEGVQVLDGGGVAEPRNPDFDAFVVHGGPVRLIVAQPRR